MELHEAGSRRPDHQRRQVMPSTFLFVLLHTGVGVAITCVYLFLVCASGATPGD